MGENRGSIGFFATYRPPVPLDIFSCPVPPTSRQDELRMTDRESSNYNCQVIPPEALKTIIKRPKLASLVKESDVDSGLVFVSERDRNLETLHIAIRFSGKFEVFSFAEVYDTFNGVRMEDSGCIAGGYMVGNRTVDHFLIYVTTKDPAEHRRQPWTAVYKTNLKTGKSDRLTPPEAIDLSPSVSPSGKKVAVASFGESGWTGEIEDLKTDIYVMNIGDNHPLDRKKVIENGGWPTWGSDNVIFFHRKVGEFWRVFQFDVNNGEPKDVTPDGIYHAMTPAAINATEVAAATIREKSEFSDVRRDAQYRHIEIFDSTAPKRPIQITLKTRPKADHFNPFVIDGGKRIGYHRCKRNLLKSEDAIEKNFHELHSPHTDVGLFRVSGVFPTFSMDGSKLAFVDNEFKTLWVADSGKLQDVYKLDEDDPRNIFSPVWNPSRENTLYVCVGASFKAAQPLDIWSIVYNSYGGSNRTELTTEFNNAFPSPNPKGTKLVFRSTRDRSTGKESDRKYKNLYIMEDEEIGENDGGIITRITDGEWTDTHCQWSPSGEWIVFSSTREKPKDAPDKDNGLDPGYFAVFLVKASDPSVVVRVIKSGDDLAGHVNHPFFSPDGKSIAVSSDLAAVSVDPISLPLFLHSVRPYGDIFTVDIDPDNIYMNENVKKFKRITHSRYENSTPSWTMFSTKDSKATWTLLLNKSKTSSCPYADSDEGDADSDEGEGWHMTGHLCLPKRCC